MLDVIFQEMMAEGGKDEVVRFLQDRGFKVSGDKVFSSRLYQRDDGLALEVTDNFSRKWYDKNFGADSLKVEPKVRVGADLHDIYSFLNIEVPKEQFEERQERLKGLMYDLQEYLSTEFNVATHIYEVEQERDV